MDNGHWIYPNDFNINNWFGFVYRIIDTVTNREYIGKKQFFTKTSKAITGRKNRAWKTKESNWKKYTSSSDEINKLIKEFGKDRFQFFIESLHATKASLTYAEVEKLIVEDALRVKLSDSIRKYYNKVIPPIKFLPPHETIDEEAVRIFALIKDIYPNENFCWEHGMTPEEKEQYKIKYRFGNNNSTIRNKTPEEYQQYLDDYFRGENNPMYGRIGNLSPRYGKKPFDNLTSEEYKELIEQISLRMSGENNPRYGKKPFDKLTKEEMDIVRSKMAHKGEENGMYGKPCHYKMTEEEKQQWKDNISKGGKGRIVTDEIKKNMSAGMKGVKKSKIECPHCGKIGGSNNMYRYHFDKCKLKPV
jgi:hypothetical protein